MQQEGQFLPPHDRCRQEPQEPKEAQAAIVSGSKLTTDITVVKALLEKRDKIIIA